jgi:hypothetical protein
MYSSKVIQEFEMSVNNNIRKLDAKEEFSVQNKMEILIKFDDI